MLKLFLARTATFIKTSHSSNPLLSREVDRAQQRPRRPDGHPRPHGAREARQQPLHHQLPPGLPRRLQLGAPSWEGLIVV